MNRGIPMDKVNVDSENILFEIVSKFQTHKEMLEKVDREIQANRLKLQEGYSIYGDRWLEHLAILMLYHGTELSAEEIYSLEYDNLALHKNYWEINTKVKHEKLEIQKGNALFEVLDILYRKNKNSRYIFTESREKVFEILDKYSRRSKKDSTDIHSYFGLTSKDFAVIPTPLRINADPRYTGKGITIAFIDSGFYPHPDLIKPENRILSYINIETGSSDWSELEKCDVDSWHGMQTSVSACGNGFLSKGLYRGIAHQSKLVLVKVAGKEGDYVENLVKAIEWVIENRERFSIRILNISLGCSSYKGKTGTHPTERAVEEAVSAGITVVIAAGNDLYEPITPPATALSAITVGGLDDQNVLFQKKWKMYHSSYASFPEGYIKPEVIAPAIWIAAPLLPGSPLYYESQVLHRIVNASKAEDILKEFLYNEKKLTLPENHKIKSPKQIKAWAEERIKTEKLVATHYQHVDGTSFASPITASVIAQMLEIKIPNSLQNASKKFLWELLKK